MNTTQTPPAPKPGPLTRRIAEVQKPEPWKPAWMRRLPATDMTGRVLTS